MDCYALAYRAFARSTMLVDRARSESALLVDQANWG
jgi:hypothetical protein